MEKNNRKAGVLLHITSLPNAYTLGTFSCECEKFIDYLNAGGFKCWEVLPFGDVDYGRSPYSSMSSFAINPYFLDLSEYLTEDEIKAFGFDKSNPDIMEEQNKFDQALDMVCDKMKGKCNTTEFEKNNKYWLENYAMYKVLKKKYNLVSWVDWPSEFRDRLKPSLDKLKLSSAKEIRKHIVIQYLLNKRWREIKKYAESKNVELFGDIPFYAQLDSADVWANQKDWKLVNGKPKIVAGVPADSFGEGGQFWGYPIYNYTNMNKNKYSFWVNRFKRTAELFDIIRIDHFVAFSKYYAIPATSTNPADGKWVMGDGKNILSKVVGKIPAKVVAEDLGTVTEEVIKLKDSYGIAGTKVMQIAFDHEGDSIYQPHNYEKNCVAYIGTHDNNTFLGVLMEGDWDKINRFKKYLSMPLEQGNDILIDNVILALYRSSANMIILTMQDILKLDSDARFNVPGLVDNKNWRWQLRASVDTALSYRYKYLSDLYAR